MHCCHLPHHLSLSLRMVSGHEQTVDDTAVTWAPRPRAAFTQDSGGTMSAVGLITGLVAAGLGLYLLSIWLIEYDRDYHAATETRLPIPVLASHVAAAVSGLALWVAYLILDSDRLAWYSLVVLLVAASLGLTMAFRWYWVYRAKRASE